MTWGIVYLGRRYLVRNRVKTCLLVIAFSLVWFLPAGLTLFVHQAETLLRSRARETPLLLGQAGSPLELVFNGLYFAKPQIAPLRYREVAAVEESGLAEAIPLYARYSAGAYRIVGTTLDYFDFRKLQIQKGEGLVELGDCVIGASVAAHNGITPGDAIISTPETLFDIAGVYPLKMKVVGVLAPTGTADDSAIFTDLRTTWIIEGLGHGHADATTLGEDEKLPSESKKADAPIRLNASVVEYNEITPDNVDDFHFHGDQGDFPVSSVIIVPRDTKAQALLKGRYASSEGPQLISPEAEMDDLFVTVFRIQGLVRGLLIVIGLGTLAMGALVFTLSYRLRREEFRHLGHLGAATTTLRALIVFEAVFVLILSLLLSGASLLVLRMLTSIILRRWGG